jgi:tetratricopeptide (TPR) repeat protein
MNLSRGWLTLGTPRCIAPVCLVVALCSLGAGRAMAVAERAYQAAEADVLPGGDQRAAPDLLLHGDAASKADALTAFSQAIIAEDSADSDAALADYQKALALDPGYTELAVRVAFELARRGNPSAGIEVLKDSIKASPKAPLAYLYLSQLYAKYLEKPDVGLKYAQQALDLDPANLASYFALYEIYAALGQQAKAVDTLNRAAKQPSTDPQFWLQLGSYYAKTFAGTPIPPADMKIIAGIYQHALASGGEDPQTLAQVADFYLLTSQEKEAIPLYLKALKLSPANPPDGDQTMVNIRENLARCFNAIGRPDDAIAALEQIIKDNPLRGDAYELLCDLYEKTGKLDAAYATCQQLILLDQTKYGNYLRAADLLIKQNKMDAAIRTLEDARVKFPNEAEIPYALGVALSAAKRYSDAVDVFEQAVDQAGPSETEMLDAKFYFMYGAAAEQAGQVAKAAELLKKSIELDPPSAAEAYNYLGYMWVDRGLNLDEAGELIKKALKMDPNNAAYIDSLGWYYFKKGDLKQALATLQTAASLIKPEDATVDEHLGDVYAATNDTAHALDYWQRSAALDKDNKEIAVKIAGARQKLAGQGTPPPASP